MKRKITYMLAIMILAASTTLVHASKSMTQSYQISVTIPAIVGQNVDEFGNLLYPKNEIFEFENQQITEVETFRDSQLVLLKSITTL